MEEFQQYQWFLASFDMVITYVYFSENTANSTLWTKIWKKSLTWVDSSWIETDGSMSWLDSTDNLTQMNP